MLYALVFAFGLVIGSFLNVVIWRIPREESIVNPPSHCPKCGHQIKPWENIPVLSYLFLRGSCSNCKTNISARYPLVEALTGILFLLVFMKFGLTWVSGLFMYFTALLIAITFIDIDHLIIPDSFLVMAALVGLVNFLFNGTEVLLDQIIGVIALGGGFWAIRFLGTVAFKKEAMGLGDVKFAALLGWTLGWQVGIVAAFLAFLAASILLLVLMPMKRLSFGQQVPFGPFIAIGTWLGLMWGLDIIDWYMGLML